MATVAAVRTLWTCQWPRCACSDRRNAPADVHGVGGRVHRVLVKHFVRSARQPAYNVARDIELRAAGALDDGWGHAQEWLERLRPEVVLRGRLIRPNVDVVPPPLQIVVAVYGGPIECLENGYDVACADADGARAATTGDGVEWGAALVMTAQRVPAGAQPLRPPPPCLPARTHNQRCACACGDGRARTPSRPAGCRSSAQGVGSEQAGRGVVDGNVMAPGNRAGCSAAGRRVVVRVVRVVRCRQAHCCIRTRRMYSRYAAASFLQGTIGA